MAHLIPMLRGLLKQPAFSLLAVLTLALGIGVNVVIFSALEALILKPLPFPDSHQLVAVYEDASWLGYAKNTPAPANFADWRREAKSFSDMAATSRCRAIFTGDGMPEEVRCRNVQANIWAILGVRPILGRTFTGDEDHPQPGVAVIGEGLWKRRFGADRDIVDRTVQINGRAMKIVGVMPNSFRFPQADIEVWMPLAFTPEQWARRGSHFLGVYGRLKPGVSVAQASREVDAIQKRLDLKYPGDSDPRQGALVERLQDALLGNMRSALWVLMAAAGVVLLIACANVANLLLTRATGRQRELAVRSALGASAYSLLALLFSETLCLTLAGGSLGILLALASRRALESFIPLSLQGAVSIGLDWRVLAFAFGASFLAAMVAAATPLLHILYSPLVNILRQDSRAGASKGSLRLRNVLVIAEVALTVTLLAGAGLMVRSLLEIWNTDIGFAPDRLMTVRIGLPSPKYEKNETRNRFYEEALDKIRALPGVRNADFTSMPPFGSIGDSSGYAIEGRTPAGQGEPNDMLTRVSTNRYFETIGAKIKEGRFFQDSDRAANLRVVVVNESFANTFYPNRSAIGRRMAFTGRSPERKWRTIVGVVRNINERGFDHFAKPVTYVPTYQNEDWSMNFLIVRSEASKPSLLINSLRLAIRAVDPGQPLGTAMTFEEILNLDQASRRQQMFLLAAFAGLSLLMACLGIYAILAYTVELRRQEIGVRMALGANTGDVMRLVMRQGLRLAVAGSALGLVAALAGGRWIENSLYGVKPFDPATLGAVIAILLLVSLAACWIPARRATARPTSDGVAAVELDCRCSAPTPRKKRGRGR